MNFCKTGEDQVGLTITSNIKIVHMENNKIRQIKGGDSLGDKR